MNDEPLSYDGEIWKPVTDPRFDEPLEASSYGRVRRSARRYWTVTKTQGGFWRYKAARLAVQVEKNGYPIIYARRYDGVYRSAAVHILVCVAFHGPRPSELHEVAHWEHGRTNARPENLRWATSKENVADFERHGVKRIGEDLHSAKLTERAVLTARDMYAHGVRRSVIAALFDVNWTTIDKAIKGEFWKHVT